MAAMKEQQQETAEPQSQSLPDDIITQILTYLPPKPLTRFKLVSKPFLSLINDPDFINLHIQRSKSTLSNLTLTTVCHSTDHLITLHFPALDHPSSSKLPLLFPPKTHFPADIIGSCNGLLLCSAFPAALSVVNPTNGTFHDIKVEDDGGGEGESIWVDFGFGFESGEGDYKVVRIDQGYEGSVLTGGHSSVGPREVRVYSLKTGNWKKVDNFPYFLPHPLSHGKYLDLANSVHWVGIKSEPAVFDLTGVLWRGRLDDVVYDYVLVGFDLRVEEFRVVELPDFGGVVVPRLSVVVLGGRLGLQVEHGPRFGRGVDVWVMEEYGVKESWRKVLRFAYEEVRGELLPVSTLALSNSGEEVLMQQGEALFWMDVRSGEVRDVEIEGGLPCLYDLVFGHRHCFGAVVGIESLIRLGGRVGDVKVEETGNAGEKDEELKAEEVKVKSKVHKKKRGDVLSSRFKLK